MVYEIFEAIQTLLAQSVMFHHLVMLLDPSLLEKEVLGLLYSVQSLGSDGDLVKNETIFESFALITDNRSFSLYICQVHICRGMIRFDFYPLLD